MKSSPFDECNQCIATNWCRRYKNEVPIPDTSFCSPKYRLDKALSLSNIPKRYREANIYNYVKDNSNEVVAEKLKLYILNILNTVEDSAHNFLFWGSKSGVGKTFHGTMLLNQYIYKTCLTSRFDFEQPLAYFINYADLMEALRYRKNDDDVTSLLNTIKEVPLLMLDDVGSGTTSNYTNEQTYLLINYRYNKDLPTIYSTNLNKIQLVEALNSRIVSRMNSKCVAMEVSGKDRR
ncbi:ATP-binding protein [Cytobacillus sp. Hm23]